MKLGIVSLDHFVLNVGDVERSLDFYAGILGLKPMRVEEFRRGDVSFPSLRVDANTIIDLFPPTMHGGAASGSNVNHICFVTERDLGDVAAELQARGVAIVDRMERNFGARGYATSIYVKDPDGNVLEIRAY